MSDYPVIVRYLHGKWQVLKVSPNGRQAVLGTFSAQFRAQEFADKFGAEAER